MNAHISLREPHIVVAWEASDEADDYSESEGAEGPFLREGEIKYHYRSILDTVTLESSLTITIVSSR